MLARNATSTLTPGLLLDFLAPNAALHSASPAQLRRHFSIIHPNYVASPALLPMDTAHRGVPAVQIPRRAYSNKPKRNVLAEKYPSTSRRPRPSLSPLPSPPPTPSPPTFSPRLAVPETQPLGVVHRLQEALKQQDIEAVWAAWKSLQDSKLLHVLGPAELQQCCRFVSTFIPPDPRQPLSPQHRTAIERIAVHTAAGRDTLALQSLMLYYLKRNELDAVLSLYDRFIDSVKEREVLRGAATDPEQDEPEEEEIESALASTSTSSNTVLFSEFIIFAVVAHAMRNDMPAVARTVAQSPFRLPYRTAINFSRELGKYAEFLPFFDNARLAGAVARPPALIGTVTKSVAARASVHVERSYSGIVEGLSASPPWLALPSSSGSSDGLPVVEESIWIVFMKAFMDLDLFELAEQLWNDMTRLGVRPSVDTWNVLLQGFAAHHGLQRTLELWEVMRLQRVQPDGWTYQALVLSLMRNGRVHDAEARFKEFYQVAAKRKSLLEDTACVEALHNSMISGYLLNKRVAEAEEVLTKMKENGPTPSIVTYNTFMAHHQRTKNFKAVSTTLQAIRASGLKGDSHTFSHLLLTLLQILPPHEAIARTRKIMQGQGVKEDAVMQTILITHLLREREQRNLAVAMDMLDQMERADNPEQHPTVVTYTTILQAIHRWEGLSSDVATEYTDAILKLMKARKVVMNTVTYNGLLRACLMNRDAIGLRHALHYYREMVSHRVTLTQDTWYILLFGLLKRGEFEVAKWMVDELERSKMRFSDPLRRLVEQTRARARASAARNDYGSYL